MTREFIRQGLTEAGYLPTTDETIPADMATPSPDDRFHHCIYYPRASAWDPWDGNVWDVLVAILGSPSSPTPNFGLRL
jgi:hypothetical protein